MTTNNRRHVKGRRKRFSGRARQAADGPPAIDVDAPKMMPGQEPYTAAERRQLYGLVGDAAEGDPGEQGEIEGDDGGV